MHSATASSRRPIDLIDSIIAERSVFAAANSDRALPVMQERQPVSVIEATLFEGGMACCGG